MKRAVVFIVFFAILGVSLAGLYWSQRRAKSPPVSPNAILDMAADAQRDLSRVPISYEMIGQSGDGCGGKNDHDVDKCHQTRNATI